MAKVELGLRDNLYIDKNQEEMSNTGMNTVDAMESVKRRYNQLTGDELPFGSLYDYLIHVPLDYSNTRFLFNQVKKSRDEIFSLKIKELNHGDYIGLLTYWEKHSFTLHAIKDKHTIHFIYVNRGERHLQEKNDGEPMPVMVFSIEDNRAESFAKNIFEALESISRDKVSNFLNSQQANLNKKLSKNLKKSDQKTGNCAVANANIAWHFRLASNYMKKQNEVSFEEAYNTTEKDYKRLRKEDREQAFGYLLQHKDEYPSEEAFFDDFRMAIAKLYGKDVKKNSSNIMSLFENLGELRYGLIESLTNNNFINIKEKVLKEGFSFLRNSILKNYFSTLSETEQQDEVRHTISALKYVDKKVQENFLSAIKEILPEMIKSGRDFRNVVQGLEALEDTQRGIVFEAMKEVLPKALKSDKNFEAIKASIPKIVELKLLTDEPGKPLKGVGPGDSILKGLVYLYECSPDLLTTENIRLLTSKVEFAIKLAMSLVNLYERNPNLLTEQNRQVLTENPSNALKKASIIIFNDMKADVNDLSSFGEGSQKKPTHPGTF